MSFLSAEWRKLALVNFEVDPEILLPYLPAGTEIDTWNGRCYVSLVGFMFVNTKLLGLSIPFHTNFEEVNLRFYVKRVEDGMVKRGVVFIKEIVPRHALTFVANTIYKEHYETLPMRHKWQAFMDRFHVEYDWKSNGNWQRLSIQTELNPVQIDPESETEFITEHYWGYTKIDSNRTFEYEVTHPKWQHYPVIKSEIDVDFGLTYGQHFEFLNDIKPTSVMLAEGSEITVENKRELVL